MYTCLCTRAYVHVPDVANLYLCLLCIILSYVNNIILCAVHALMQPSGNLDKMQGLGFIACHVTLGMAYQPIFIYSS